MNKKIISYLVLLFVYASAFAQIHAPARWHFEKKITGENSADLIIRATIDRGWYLYGREIPRGGPIPTSIVFETVNNAILEGEIRSLSASEFKFDPNFDMELTLYSDEAIFIQSISFSDAEKIQIEGYVEFMVCSATTCLPPTQEHFKFGASANETTQATVDATTTIAFAPLQIGTTTAQTSENVLSRFWTPVIDELQALGEISSANFSLWWIFLLGLLGGFLSLLTPCVWPIIPMTVGFFLKRSQNKTRGRKDAVLYGASIVMIYVMLGLLITIIFGSNALNNMATSAVFNIFIFALLITFAVSFFGAFEITLPAKWVNKMDAKADSTAGFISILFMAFTLVLVSFSCTGPILGILLVEVSSANAFLAPLFGMFGFAVALAIPFSLFAFFPAWLKSMPKSGGWLNKIKVALAFIILAFSLKFFSVADLAYGWRILDREVFIVLWVVIFALLGFYLLGKLRFSHDSEEKQTSIPSLFMAIFAFAFALYLIPGLWGAPLKAASSFLPPLHTQDFNLSNSVSRADFQDFDEGMLHAARVGKPVLVYFTGHGCGSCRKMDAMVLSNSRVREVVESEFVLIKLYVDERTSLENPFEIEENGRIRRIRTLGDKWSFLQRHKFGANAQPFFVILDNDGKPLNRSFAFDENPQHFLDWLRLK